MRLGEAAAALMLIALGGCASPGRVLVVVDTDLQVGAEIEQIDLTAHTPVSLPRTRTVEAAALPSTLLVEPRGSSREVTIRVAARDAEDHVWVWRRVDTRVIPGRTLQLDVPLARVCAGEERCGDQGMTCSEGECVPYFVDPAGLPDGDPGADAMRLFMGPSDPDAGTPDAGPPCVQGSPCNLADPCLVGEMDCSGDLPECEQVGLKPEGTLCDFTDGGISTGRTCSADGVCGTR